MSERRIIFERQAAEIAALRRALTDLIGIYERPREGWGVEEVLRLREIRNLAHNTDSHSKIRELLPRAKRRRHKRRRSRFSGGGE